MTKEELVDIIKRTMLFENTSKGLTVAGYLQYAEDVATAIMEKTPLVCDLSGCKYYKHKRISVERLEELCSRFDDLINSYKWFDADMKKQAEIVRGIILNGNNINDFID